MSPRWSSYVAPKFPRGGSKTQNGRFPSKIALRLKKVCYKVSLYENCQRQSYKAFIGLTIRAKVIGGGRLLLPEILGGTAALEQIVIFRYIFARTVSAATPRWTSYVVPKPPKGGQEHNTAVFRVKSHYLLQSFFMKKLSASKLA